MSLCWLTMWKVSFIFFPSVDSYFHIWKQTNLRRIMLAVDTLFLFCVFCVADFREFLTIFKYFLCSLFNLCLSTFPLEKTLATFWSYKTTCSFPSAEWRVIRPQPSTAAATPSSSPAPSADCPGRTTSVPASGQSSPGRGRTSTSAGPV